MKFRIRLCLLTLALACIAMTALAQEEEGKIPQLSVSGEAQIQVPADQLRLSIGVITQATTAEKALQENNRRMREVAKALHEAGLTEKELETGQFRIEPQWSSPPSRPETEWRSRIVGYSVTNTLRLRTIRLELTGPIIAAAGAAGANQIGALEFDLADPRKHRSEAIRTATANARADAAVLAEAAAVRLVRVLSLNLDPDMPMPMYAATDQRFAMKAEADVPVIAPGEVTVRATVHLVYAVAE